MPSLPRLSAFLLLCASALAGCAPSPESAWTRPLEPGEVAAAMTHRKMIEYRPDGSEGVLKLYDHGLATYAGSQAQWAAPWRAEGGGLCFEAPHDLCYDLAVEKERWFVATPRDGSAPRRWFEMKSIDEPANVQPDLFWR